MISSLTAGILLFGSSALAQGIYNSGTLGVDVSWPNCSAKITRGSKFGIVGVTNGIGYSTNPCLNKEASNFSNLSLYVNTGWYSSSLYINANSPKKCIEGDNNCLAYNYGYNAGLYAYDAAANAGVHSNTWWLDVETENSWSTDTSQNRNSIQGEYNALTTRIIDNGAIPTVGVYSTTYQWNTITGSWKNYWPSWGATIVSTSKQAAKYCTGHEFTGGKTWLIQYSGAIDQDYAC